MARKYGSKAQSKVKHAMHERKHGTLHSGRSHKKVTSRKQAIAIGLSEARAEGDKVPSNPHKSSRSSHSSHSRSSSHKKSSSRHHRTSSKKK